MSAVRLLQRSRAAALAFVLLAGLGACTDDNPAGPEPPLEETPATLTVDASEGWAFVDLGSTASTVSVSDPTASSAWDIGLFATSVMLNGGAAGPAGVVGHCLCQNAGATDAQLQAMTSESELADFTSVTEAQIPAADSAWTSDALSPAIDGWYVYNPATHVVSAAPEKAWKIRTAEGTGFAKFRVTDITNPGRSNAGQVTFEYAVQSAAGAPMGETRTATVDLSSGGEVHFDFLTGSVSDASDWDVRFEGYTIRVNGGVSGEGEAGAVAVTEPFESITDASDIPAQVYRGDAFGGVFDSHPWYRYNLAGNHQVWPTYDVYLVRAGDEVYKVQIIGYYGATGDSRQITLRYARLAG